MYYRLFELENLDGDCVYRASDSKRLDERKVVYQWESVRKSLEVSTELTYLFSKPDSILRFFSKPDAFLENEKQDLCKGRIYLINK